MTGPCARTHPPVNALPWLRLHCRFHFNSVPVWIDLESPTGRTTTSRRGSAARRGGCYGTRRGIKREDPPLSGLWGMMRLCAAARPAGMRAGRRHSDTRQRQVEDARRQRPPGGLGARARNCQTAPLQPLQLPAWAGRVGGEAVLEAAPPLRDSGGRHGKRGCQLSPQKDQKDHTWISIQKDQPASHAMNKIQNASAVPSIQYRVVQEHQLSILRLLQTE